MLPPETINPTRRPVKRAVWASTAASGAALDFVLRNQQNIVDQGLDDRSGEPPRLLDCDALGDGVARRAPAPAFNGMGHRRVERAASTLMISMSGLIALAPPSLPAINPPPPTGTTRISRSGLASNISSATVPWPEMTALSS